MAIRPCTLGGSVSKTRLFAAVSRRLLGYGADGAKRNRRSSTHRFSGYSDLPPIGDAGVDGPNPPAPPHKPETAPLPRRRHIPWCPRAVSKTPPAGKLVTRVSTVRIRHSIPEEPGTVAVPGSINLCVSSRIAREHHERRSLPRHERKRLGDARVRILPGRGPSPQQAAAPSSPCRP